MIKKIFLSLGAALVTGTAMAQVCATDEVTRDYKSSHPGIAADQARLDAEIQSQMRYFDPRNLMKGTGADTDTVIMHIPVVVHVMHDYGSEYVSDNAVYTMIREMNELYSRQNTLSSVIAPFVPYIGNAHIQFHLATKDPQGNPTHGITRRRTYLTQGGDDQAKLDYWPQNQYLNLWLINHIGLGLGGSGIVAAYSAFPFSANSMPYYDGVIANYQFINNSSNSNNTMGHEVGHSFSLYHPWNSSNQSVGVACGDDQVDDTPPTKGHFSGCDLYDTDCALGYSRNGIDYPDTTNTQNVMDYANCSIMFTKGQVERMRATLRSTTGNRSNLWSAGNLAATGALNARPSLPPVADLSVNRVFYCASATLPITFTNRSWNDTVTSVSWTFSNGATTPASTSVNSVSNTFSVPGWPTVTLQVNGLHGNVTATRQPVYIADQASLDPATHTGEFTAATRVDQYPMFDYYNTGRKWELTSTGYNDNASVRYVNKESRTGTALLTGTPSGDYSDFFTPAFDLSGAAYASNCNLNFMTAGAYRTGSQQNDVLEIAYSKDCGLSWIKMDSLKGGALANNGTVSADFVPQSGSQWVSRSRVVPANARTARTFFRFRFLAGANNSGVATGNNFYMDRIQITGLPTGVNGVELNATGMEIAPNPTTGDAFILLKNAGNGKAYVQITDITGKNVYATDKQVTGDVFRIDIPASSIYAKGIYLVKVVAGTQTYTRKLVVQ